MIAPQQKNAFNYFIYGLLVPRGVETGKGYYVCDLLNNYFQYNGDPVKLVLNLKTSFTFCGDGDTLSQNEILFKLRDSIVIDIQHKIAGYNSRPGHILLS